MFIDKSVILTKKRWIISDISVESTENGMLSLFQVIDSVNETDLKWSTPYGGNIISWFLSQKIFLYGA